MLRAKAILDAASFGSPVGQGALDLVLALLIERDRAHYCVHSSGRLQTEWVVLNSVRSGLRGNERCFHRGIVTEKSQPMARCLAAYSG